MLSSIVCSRSVNIFLITLYHIPRNDNLTFIPMRILNFKEGRKRVKSVNDVNTMKGKKGKIKKKKML